MARNGTFRAIDLPGALLYLREPRRSETVSGSGRWGVQQSEGAGKVELDFSTFAHDGPTMTSFRTSLSVAIEEGHYILYFWLGDPDDGKRIVLTRVQKDTEIRPAGL